MIEEAALTSYPRPYRRLLRPFMLFGSFSRGFARGSSNNCCEGAHHVQGLHGFFQTGSRRRGGEETDVVYAAMWMLHGDFRKFSDNILFREMSGWRRLQLSWTGQRSIGLRSSGTICCAVRGGIRMRADWIGFDREVDKHSEAAAL